MEFSVNLFIVLYASPHFKVWVTELAGQLKKILNIPPNSENLFRPAIWSSASFIALPTDLIKIRLSRDVKSSQLRHKGLINECREMIREEGLRA
ncbi:unnamed protein product [Blepharisma stoltei]|uniref:Uncharacterized protein n=1 Tax=Blepharisma stoltei TaxID=1481888 RepID=A0AAU9JTR5_9CILI|nr:unnamed protein product [Blepharisma stoltei]